MFSNSMSKTMGVKTYLVQLKILCPFWKQIIAGKSATETREPAKKWKICQILLASLALYHPKNKLVKNIRGSSISDDRFLKILHCHIITWKKNICNRVCFGLRLNLGNGSVMIIFWVTFDHFYHEQRLGQLGHYLKLYSFNLKPTTLV